MNCSRWKPQKDQTYTSAAQLLIIQILETLWKTLAKKAIDVYLKNYSGGKKSFMIYDYT